MRRSIRVVTALAVASLTSAGVVGVAPASSAAGKLKGPIDCPKAFPTSKAVKGVSGTGFTVETGTTPAPFSAKILGRITDGLLPGTDLILAKVSSPALSRAHGVWSGMSGSPVYSSDGRLIGSVSYGLAGNSDIAGITPGPALLSVLSASSTTAARRALEGPRRIGLGKAQQQALVDAGVSAHAAASGLSRIPLPVSISGRPTKRLLDYVKSIPDVRVVTGASRPSAKVAKTSGIHAGGNFVEALSYGDITIAAVGTTTLVCKGKAVAFGHPLLDAGPVSMTAHVADAVLVQPDPLFGPFKVANVGRVVGVVDRDQFMGVRAVLGGHPQHPALVSTSFRLGRHAAVKGTTTVNFDPALAYAAANHVYVGLIRTLGHEGRGSARVTITITGVRGNGRSFTLTRPDVYGDPNSLPFAVADTIYSMTQPLSEQEFEDAHVTRISVTGTVETAVRRFSVSKVEAQQGSSWVRLGTGPVSATAGTPLPLRLTLTPYKGIGASKLLPISLPVPAGTAGAPAGLELTAGSDASAFDTGGASSFGEILTILARAPRNDEVRARLVNTESGDVLSSRTAHTGAALAPYGNFFGVNIS